MKKAKYVGMPEEDAVDLLTGTALRAYVGEQKTTLHTYEGA